MSFKRTHPLRLLVQSNNSFFVTKCRFLLDRLRNTPVDLFLVRVDELWFVLFLYQLVQLPSVVLVTPFGSCFFVLVILLGILRFVFGLNLSSPQYFPLRR
jgi:hypothetical protein